MMTDKDQKRRKKVLKENADVHRALIERLAKAHAKRVLAIPDDMWKKAEEQDAET